MEEFLDQEQETATEKKSNQKPDEDTESQETFSMASRFKLLSSRDMNSVRKNLGKECSKLVKKHLDEIIKGTF
eukprot:CAMPEP_0184485784 /NCGR_PEP_ID=MMETSP0113_2-20130426/7379_1 /TAXON_ID=91329 /ORGANISM="Norrisiella sphaerica, Strain BC52" /LENGTH=72 /DNA_ID=CAMNT_0026867397 /DNA_START=9 /DNA_END=227 /DNA_ORIENTATION=+